MPSSTPGICHFHHYQSVLKIIDSIKPTTSAADFIPTALIQSCCGVFFPEIRCYLANLSFSQGVFPQSYKSAFITPLLNKTGSNSDSPSNYRPISNLNNISKITERLFLCTFQPHVVHIPATFQPAPPLTPSNLLTTQVTQLKQLFFSLLIVFIPRLIQDRLLCS